MKTKSASLLGAALLLVAFTITARAVTPVFYGVNLSASLSTEVDSGSSSTVHTVHFNNKSIIDPIFLSGSSGAAKESDLTLVLASDGDISVVRITSTNVVPVLEIAGTGSNSSTNSIAIGKGAIKSVTEAQADYEFLFPGLPEVQVTNVRVTGKADLSTGSFTKVLISFFGGNGNSASGATLFQGTIRQTGKLYH